MFFLGKLCCGTFLSSSPHSSCHRRFGNQGAAQAQNLRDSGIPNDKILVANRDDSYAEDAKSKKFTVTSDFAKSAEVADGIYLKSVWLKRYLMPCSSIVPLDTGSGSAQAF